MEEGPKRNYIAEVIDAHMRLLRRERRETTDEIAAGIGITRMTLNTLRRGTSNFCLPMIAKVAKYFQWGPEEIGMAVWYADTFEKKPKGKSRRRRGVDGELREKEEPRADSTDHHSSGR